MRALALALLVTAGPALAEDPDEAALALADKTQPRAERPSDWRVLAETALVRTAPRTGAAQHAQRLSLDGYYDAALAPGWRAVFSNRLDLVWRGDAAYDNFINTLKEAYVTWQPRADDIFDLGRVNLRHGVAAGYNPTDYFRAGAIRSVVSIAPASLRENRLGTVMLRGQTLWSGGSFSALYSPELAARPNSSPFSPDFGATNDRDRWLLALSQKLGDDLNPQWLLYGEEGGAAQLGINLTTLINDATVGYLEWSGGRGPSLLTQALALPDDDAFRSRAAAGFTYTAPSKLSLTVEYDYNGAGVDEAAWRALRQGPPDDYAQFRRFTAARQELPTKQNAFIFARWQDALIMHLDVSAMHRRDLVDQSVLWWLETRYHWNRVDLALQWQQNRGGAGSQFGAPAPAHAWQAIVTYFF